MPAHHAHSNSGARWRTQWSIDLYTGATLTSLAPLDGSKSPMLTARAATDIAGAAVADPFLLRRDGGWFLFFEIWNTAVDRGEIAVATSLDGCTWSYERVVLREPFHLSYPQVVATDGTVFMVPEARQDSAVHLYAAVDFPLTWQRVTTLLRGAYADATVLQHEGRWWLFAQRGLDELCLFSADALTGPWRPHPASPLCVGNRRRTRPGGRVLEEDGRLIRFAQDGWPTYGHCLRAFEITELSPTRYAERELDASPILRASRRGWNAIGMHHIDAVRRDDGSWLAVVDGATPARF